MWWRALTIWDAALSKGEAAVVGGSPQFSHQSCSTPEEVVSAAHTQETARLRVIDLSTHIQVEIDLQPRTIQMVDFLWRRGSRSPSDFGQRPTTFGRRHLHSCIDQKTREENASLVSVSSTFDIAPYLKILGTLARYLADRQHPLCVASAG
jgi:hypothetical protein